MLHFGVRGTKHDRVRGPMNHISSATIERACTWHYMSLCGGQHDDQNRTEIWQVGNVQVHKLNQGITRHRFGKTETTLEGRMRWTKD